MLQGDEARHATKVLRLREGSPIIVFDGKGRSARARIGPVLSANEAAVAIEETLPSSPELPRITLCQSIPKGGNMDLIIQKAVELGVTRIIPLITEHTIVRINPKEAETKRSKWQRNALEACKQCGQNTLPVVELPQTFNEWISGYTVPPLAIIASLAPGALPIRNVLEQARKEQCREAAVLVGPEGDFTLSEIECSLAVGFRPVTLGPIVLRVETATFFCLSALRYSLD